MANLQIALSVLAIAAIIRLKDRGLEPLDAVEIATICLALVVLAIVNWLERE